MQQDRRPAVAIRVTDEMLQEIDAIALRVSRPGCLVSRHRIASRLLALGVQAVRSRGHAQVATKDVMICLCGPGGRCSSCPSAEELAELNQHELRPLSLPEIGSGRRS